MARSDFDSREGRAVSPIAEERRAPRLVRSVYAACLPAQREDQGILPWMAEKDASHLMANCASFLISYACRIAEEVPVAAYTRTTVALPAALLKSVDRAVREGRARNRNEFLIAALRRELAEQERAAVDATFAEWSDDRDAGEEALTIAAEFATSDWEALEAGDAAPQP